MTVSEPPRPQQGTTASQRDPHASDLERELAAAQSWPQKILAAANPKLYFGTVSDYPAGVKQFLWLCLGILYPFWLIGVAIAWPVSLVLKVVGAVLFEVWWFFTGWFWKRLGGEKQTRDTWKAKDAERQAKIEAIRAERYE